MPILPWSSPASVSVSLRSYTGTSAYSRAWLAGWRSFDETFANGFPEASAARRFLFLSRARLSTTTQWKLRLHRERRSFSPGKGGGKIRPLNVICANRGGRRISGLIFIYNVGNCRLLILSLIFIRRKFVTGSDILSIWRVIRMD